VTRVSGRLVAQVSATIVITLFALRLWPHASLAARVPLSTDVWSADGELLRVTRASDDQFRLWTPLRGISPTLIDAFLLKEDRWFYWNAGFNPIALTRAAVRSYRDRARQGGSTLTMQLARILYRLNTRTPPASCARSRRALARSALLEARAARGVSERGAVRRQHSGRRRRQPDLFRQDGPIALTLGEALTLAVIPQRPSSRAGRAVPEAVLRAPGRLGRLWLRSHGNTGRTAGNRTADRRAAAVRDAAAGAALRRRAAGDADGAAPAESTRRSTRRCSACRAADPRYLSSTAIAAVATRRRC
jgi:penicillin-binding protein 1C